MPECAFLIRRKEQILSQLKYRPNLKIFIKNAINALSPSALQHVVDFAKKLNGDISLHQIKTVVEQYHRNEIKPIRIPKVLFDILQSRRYSTQEKQMADFLFHCIIHFYETKAAAH